MLDLTDRLARLDAAKARLDALRPFPSAVLEEMRHRYEVRLTYHSTAIEGNTLTQSETQIVLEKGVAIGGKSVAEHLEVIGHRDALDFVRLLADRREPIGEREIREVHSLVMRGQGSDPGAYRTLDVMAAGTEFRYPSPLHVPELMRDFAPWLAAPNDLHPVIRASEAHLRFVTVHPFPDGNGRVGRLLLNLMLLRAGYPIAVIPVAERPAYIAALEGAQSRNDPAPLHHLTLAAVEASLQDWLQTASPQSRLEAP